MLPAYGTLLGYTEEELLANFKPSLQFASEATQASLDDLIERLLTVSVNRFIISNKDRNHVQSLLGIC